MTGNTPTGLREWATARDGESAAVRDTRHWTRLVRGEYLEIPGLCLTEVQVERLWGIDADLAGKVLNALVEAKFLQRKRRVCFVRVEPRPRKPGRRDAVGDRHVAHAEN